MKKDLTFHVGSETTVKPPTLVTIPIMSYGTGVTIVYWLICEYINMWILCKSAVYTVYQLQNKNYQICVCDPRGMYSYAYYIYLLISRVFYWHSVLQYFVTVPNMNLCALHFRANARARLNYNIFITPTLNCYDIIVFLVVH